MGIIQNEEFGYYQLEPIPSQEELNKFYEKEYYKKLEKVNKSKESTLLNKTDNRNIELEWLRDTCYRDIVYYINKFIEKNNDNFILDVGCGSGELINYMKNEGFNCIGIEPSIEAYKKAKDNGLQVYNSTLENFYNDKHLKFDVINMTNVLEHLREPLKCIEICKELLNDNGVLRIQVPNDFNELQITAHRKLNTNKWWVCIPDHISYFSFQSLRKILEHNGFEIILETADFPMELFLLMGDDYISQKELGKICHEKRKNLELSISPELRRDIYCNLAKLNLGRNIIMYAKLNKL